MSGSFATECIGEVAIRGREKPITIYSLSAGPIAMDTQQPAEPEAEAEIRYCLTIKGFSQDNDCKIYLSVEKSESPLDDPVGQWNGQIEAVTIAGERRVFQGTARIVIGANQSLQLECTGTVRAGALEPSPWSATGTGSYAASKLRRTVSVRLALDGVAHDCSFPVLLDKKLV